MLGLALSLNAVRLWGSERFGDLVPTQMLRWVIPAITSLILATQMALGGFFLGLVRLRLRR